MLTFLLFFLTDDFPPPHNSEPPRKDGTYAEPMPAEEAAAKWTLPEGFRVRVFASEPDVMNPIGANWDGKGRLWVAENFTYAERSQKFDLSLRDRVIVLEDTDGDGLSDKRTVFTDNVQMLTSVCPGPGRPAAAEEGGERREEKADANDSSLPPPPSSASEARAYRRGVWLMCPPRLLFIPDEDMDLVPDGPPETVLDGFTVAEANYHNFANGLKWGPDGWLYGRCGCSCPGRVGKPGTPAEQRVALEGGIWRYSLDQDRFEVLCHGTTNPWGHDWDANGEMFFCNTVNGHMWHMIPGAHYTRPFTLDPNTRTYELIDFHADHWHFPTDMKWNESRDGAANDFGGGHAHCGVLIYQGGAWPERYDGKLFTLNIHGRRINMESIHPKGSGYVIKHEVDAKTGTDPFIAADPFFRGMDLLPTPDGQVLILDWSDTGECHEHTGVHRQSGRIYRLEYQGNSGRKYSQVDHRGADVVAMSADQLGAAEKSPNVWLRRASRVETRTAPRLEQIMSSQVDIPTRDELRANLFLRVEQIDGLGSWLATDDCFGPPTEKLADGSPNGRHDLVADIAATWLEYARSEAKGRVRLSLASALQRLPVSSRAELAAALVAHPEDADDHNLPLLVWYGLMPCEADDLATVAKASTWPTTTRLITRRLSELIEDEPATLDSVLKHAASSPLPPRADRRVGEDVESRDEPTARQSGLGESKLLLAVLDGLDQGLRGVPSATKPASWDAFAAAVRETGDADAIETLTQLEAVFGGGRSIEQLRASLLDKNEDIAVRRSALESLTRVKAVGITDAAAELLGDARINVQAARAVALSNDPQIGRRLAEAYRRFRAPRRPEVVSILASRASFAAALLDAVESGKIPVAAITAADVRRMRSLGDDNLSARIVDLWGEVRETPEERKKLIEATRAVVETGDNADLRIGKQLFKKSCANCHKLYGRGGDFGPELTGANRGNLDYLLENILDPSAVVSKDYRRSVVVTTDGRVLDGVVTREDGRTLTLKNDKGETTIAAADVEGRQQTPQSPMPEGLLDRMSTEEVRALFAYLRHPVPVD